MKKWRIKDVGVFLLGTSWLLALPVGVTQLLTYANVPGASANAPVFWPSHSSAARNPGKMNLVLFIHPQCPCSVATLDNLESLVSLAPLVQPLVQVDVFFYKPAHRPDSWIKSEIWAKSAKIRGVINHIDTDGVEAARFDSTTSGQALLYGYNGKRLFEGGITSHRGMNGRSAGLDAIIALVKSESPAIVTSPVFGCSLKHPERSVAREDSL